jgi:hypothetical protein
MVANELAFAVDEHGLVTTIDRDLHSIQNMSLSKPDAKYRRVRYAHSVIIEGTFLVPLDAKEKDLEFNVPDCCDVELELRPYPRRLRCGILDSH